MSFGETRPIGGRGIGRALGRDLGASLGLGALGSGGGGAIGVQPPAPTLDWTSASSVIAPLFNVDLDNSIVAGDKFQLQYQTAGGNWSGATTVNHTLSSGEDLAAAIAMGIGNLADGSYDVRCRVAYAVSPTTWSNWSNVETITILFVASPTYFFSATDKHATINRSNQNLTATWTDGGPYANARATFDLAGKKTYFEVNLTNGNSLVGIGLTNTSYDVTGSHFLGNDVNGAAWNPASGNFVQNAGSLGGTSGTGTTGDVIRVCIDDTSGHRYITAAINGGAFGGSGGVADPVTGANCPVYASLGAGPLLITICGYDPASVTLNLGYGAMAYAIPSGYSTPE